MGDCKRILDSVHGYIYIDNSLMDNFVDTPYFQRLRRIEQTSGRSIYPSARHDRFIHSLGVYHLGTRIVQSIVSKPLDFGYEEQHDIFFLSYKIACLMHDCGHTPFSHNFENYFRGENDELLTLLASEMDNGGEFLNDARVKDIHGQEIQKKVATHEYLSAILCLKKYKEKILNLKAIPDLIARMIVGIPYQKEHSFENCLISLLNGSLIDADRLDYVCRDRWASGYSTSTVDVERLITSIHIIWDKSNMIYKVCYDPSALHDIEGVLRVKQFQQSYVINHHTVCYEQMILRRAMENTVYKLINDKNPSTEEDATAAMKSFCAPSILWDGLNDYGLSIQYLMDDDFVYLMKQNLEDKYVRQWFSRNYEMQLLWKNKTEYYSMFPIHKTENFDEFNSIFKKCDPKNLCKVFKQFKEDDFLRLRAEEKQTKIQGVLNLLMSNDKIEQYSDLYSIANEEEPNILFFYLYLSKAAMQKKDEIIAYLDGE